MAKNKLRGQKYTNVFHISSQKIFKAKKKAKPVTAGCWWLMPVILFRRLRSGGSRFEASPGK
jgi:hypothetical protein